MLGTCLLDDEAALFGFPDEHSNSNCDNKGHDCKGEGRCAPGDVAGLERKCEVAAQDDRHGLACEDERLPQTADITQETLDTKWCTAARYAFSEDTGLECIRKVGALNDRTSLAYEDQGLLRLHAAVRILHFMAQASFMPSINAQPSILNLDEPMPECAVEALHCTEVWEGLRWSRLWFHKGLLAEPVWLKDSSPDALGGQQIGHQRDRQGQVDRAAHSCNHDGGQQHAKICCKALRIVTCQLPPELIPQRSCIRICM